MKKVLALVLAVIMVLSVALTGCSNSNEETTTKAPEQTTSAPAGETTTEATTADDGIADEQKTLVLTYSSNPDGLDVHKFQTPVVRVVLAGTQTNLTRQNGSAIVPDAAESWEMSEDGLTWTFHLREGLVWADGTTPLTAQQYVDSFMRHMSPDTATATGSVYALDYVNATAFYNGEVEWSEVGIKALDDRTIEFKTNYYVDLPTKLVDTQCAPIQLDQVEAWGEQYGGSADKYLSSGPFKVTEWVHEEYVTMVKNEHYWDAENVYLEEVRVEIVPSSDTAALMFDQGEVDFVTLSTAQILAYQDSPYAQSVQTGALYTLTQQQRIPELSNLNMKYAMGWAIDREAMCNNILYGSAQPALRIIGDTAQGSVNGQYTLDVPNIKLYDVNSDLTKAKDYMAKALADLNLASADGLEFALLTGDDDGSRLIAEYLQDLFKNELGLNITVNMQVSQQRWTLFRAGEYELKWHGFTSAGDMIDYIDAWATGGNFYQHSGWSLEPEFQAFDDMITKYRYSTDKQERTNIMAQAEEYFLLNGATIPVYFGSSVCLVDTDTFGNITFNAAGIPVNYVYAYTRG